MTCRPLGQWTAASLVRPGPPEAVSRENWSQPSHTSLVCSNTGLTLSGWPILIVLSRQLDTEQPQIQNITNWADSFVTRPVNYEDVHSEIFQQDDISISRKNKENGDRCDEVDRIKIRRQHSQWDWYFYSQVFGAQGHFLRRRNMESTSVSPRKIPISGSENRLRQQSFSPKHWRRIRSNLFECHWWGLVSFIWPEGGLGRYQSLCL